MLPRQSAQLHPVALCQHRSFPHRVRIMNWHYHLGVGFPSFAALWRPKKKRRQGIRILTLFSTTRPFLDAFEAPEKESSGKIIVLSQPRRYCVATIEKHRQKELDENFSKICYIPQGTCYTSQQLYQLVYINYLLNASIDQNATSFFRLSKKMLLLWKILET